MIRAIYLVVLALGVQLAGYAPASAAGPLYDVSYLWHEALDGVYAYRNRIAPVLGPDVARKLKVVQGSRLYGLVYHRRGDAKGASKVARAHTKLLRARGLEPAAPIRSEDWWTFVSTPEQARVRTHPRPADPVVGHDVRTGPRPAKTEASGDATSRELEAAVESYIKRLRREGRIASDERTAWSVYDFTTGEKLVDINEDVQFQAASLVKPFFALAFFHKVRAGQLIYGRKSRRHMERMIQQSNNPSTNWVIRHVGGPGAVQRLLKRHYPHIFQDTLIVEYIPAGGRTYRNKASVHDYSRFLHALWTEGIPGAREIKRLMSLPGPDRLLTGTRDIPRGTKVYNKTGSTARLCGDMGILIVEGRDGKRYPYTVVGVIEKRRRARSYGSWVRSRGDIIRRVSNIVYLGISRHHNLPSTL